MQIRRKLCYNYSLPSSCRMNFRWLRELIFSWSFFQVEKLVFKVFSFSGSLFIKKESMSKLKKLRLRSPVRSWIPPTTSSSKRTKRIRWLAESPLLLPMVKLIFFLTRNPFMSRRNCSFDSLSRCSNSNLTWNFFIETIWNGCRPVSKCFSDS